MSDVQLVQERRPSVEVTLKAKPISRFKLSIETPDLPGMSTEAQVCWVLVPVYVLIPKKW